MLLTLYKAGGSMKKRKNIIRISEETINLLIVDKNKIKIEENIEEKSKFKIGIKKRKVSVILEGEELFIKYFTIPLYCKSTLREVIKNKLVGLYGSNMINILFSYSIINEGDSDLEVIVYCINSSNLEKNKQYIFNTNIVENVSLMQYYFLKYYDSAFKHRKFIFVFSYNEVLYIQFIKNKNILTNFSYTKPDDKNRLLYDFINNIFDEYYEEHCEEIVVYTSHFEVHKKFLPSNHKYNIVNLDEVDEKLLYLEMEKKK